MTEVATIVDIVRLKEQGLSKRAVARRLGICRTTVNKYWSESTDPYKPRYARRPHLIDPYRDYITSRLDKYPELPAYRLYKEIKKGVSEIRAHRAALRTVSAPTKTPRIQAL